MYEWKRWMGEDVREEEKEESMRIMAIKKNVTQGWGKGTRSLVNYARIALKKSRLKWNVNTCSECQ